MLSLIIIFNLQKVESRKTILMKDAMSTFCMLAVLGSAIAAAVIIVGKSAVVTSDVLPAGEFAL